jgi:hypothetical protein
LVPFEANNFIIQKLENGNYEVKPDFLLAHFELLVKARTLQLKVKKLEAIIQGDTND